MILNENIYKVLKILVQIALPAIIVLYLTIDGIMVECGLDGLPHPTVVVGFMAVAELLLGAAIGVSTYKYEGSGTLMVDKTSGCDNLYRFDFNTELSDLAEKKSFIIMVDDTANLSSQE